MIILFLLLLLLPGVAWADTYYLANANIVASTLETLETSAPSTLDYLQGWVVATKTVGAYAAYRPDTVITRTSQDWVGSEPSSFTGRGYRTTNTLSGSFSPGNWTLNFKISSGNLYYVQTGYVKYRLWRSTNAAGTGATQITPGWQTSTLISWTAANQTKTFSTVWAAANRVAMAGEYLFLEVEWACVGSGGNNSATVYWSHNEGLTESLVTPAFAPAALSGAATLAAVTATGTMAEVVNISGVATLGNVTSQVTVERGAGVSLSADATIGAVTANGTAAEVVTLGSSGPIMDMGVYERKTAINTSLPTLSSVDIQVFFPNETVRFDMQGSLAAVTSATTVNEGAFMSMSYLPTANPVRDMGAWETYLLSPYNASAEITMTTDFSTVTVGLSANLTSITGSITANEGAGISLAGTLSPTAANILLAEIVSAEMAGNAPNLTGQIDILGDPNQPFINPIPGMSLGLTPNGANIPNWRRR